MAFGFSPKISTTVENTVEKRDVPDEPIAETSIFGLFSCGEASGRAEKSASVCDACVISP
jgi:hypothetical protein